MAAGKRGCRIFLRPKCWHFLSKIEIDIHNSCQIGNHGTSSIVKNILKRYPNVPREGPKAKKRREEHHLSDAAEKVALKDKNAGRKRGESSNPRPGRFPDAIREGRASKRPADVPREGQQPAKRRHYLPEAEKKVVLKGAPKNKLSDAEKETALKDVEVVTAPTRAKQVVDWLLFRVGGTLKTPEVAFNVMATDQEARNIPFGPSQEKFHRCFRGCQKYS